MNTKLEPLTARMEHLEQDNNALKIHHDTTIASLRAELAHERGKNDHERRRLRIQAGLACFAFLTAVLITPGNRAAIAQGYGVTLASLNLRLAAVEAKTQFQSANPTARSTTFSGCNVFVNAGGGGTSTITTNAAGDGLGNLIIGYNALRSFGGDDRTGSHNLILGDQNNYSSYGGLVAGNHNGTSGVYSSVSGGSGNTASGDNSSVSGGSGNTASGPFCSISGGAYHAASGYSSSISGGYANTAIGNFSSVSGGGVNTASSYYCSVSGGAGNTASNYYCSVSGGTSVNDGDWSGWAGGSYHSP